MSIKQTVFNYEESYYALTTEDEIFYKIIGRPEGDNYN